MSCNDCNSLGICPIKWGVILLVLCVPTGIGIASYNAAAERVIYERLMDTEWMCKESGVVVQFDNDRAYFVKGEQVLAILDVEQDEAGTIWSMKRLDDTLLISWMEEDELHIGGEGVVHKELNGVYGPPPESFKIRLPIEDKSGNIDLS